MEDQIATMSVGLPYVYQRAFHRLSFFIKHLAGYPDYVALGGLGMSFYHGQVSVLIQLFVFGVKRAFRVGWGQ